MVGLASSPCLVSSISDEAPVSSGDFFAPRLVEKQQSEFEHLVASIPGQRWRAMRRLLPGSLAKVDLA